MFLWSMPETEDRFIRDIDFWLLNSRYARRDSGHYGANAVQPAFGGSPPEYPGCTAGGFPFIHIPNGMRLKGKGLSHGLKAGHPGGTPEGTRYTKVLPPSSRRQATVHRTVAFYCSSPFYLEYKNGVSPKGYTVFGTPEGTRTPNPRNRNPMLYPLSHWRIHLKCLAIIADKAGFVKSQMAKKFSPGAGASGENGSYSSTRAMCTSSSCFWSTVLGAPIIRSWAFLFMGKVMTSRMLSSPVSIMISRSTPGAAPAWGGAP